MQERIVSPAQRAKHPANEMQWLTGSLVDFFFFCGVFYCFTVVFTLCDTHPNTIIDDPITDDIAICPTQFAYWMRYAWLLLFIAHVAFNLVATGWCACVGGGRRSASVYKMSSALVKLCAPRRYQETIDFFTDIHQPPSGYRTAVTNLCLSILAQVFFAVTFAYRKKFGTHFSELHRVPLGVFLILGCVQIVINYRVVREVRVIYMHHEIKSLNAVLPSHTTHAHTTVLALSDGRPVSFHTQLQGTRP
eukprot:GDKI01049021.1.p1 GENE.GDKI01049021.1~~GDKI01049021.1.p1  ORF type:complete len:264 (+),score=45.52 GDKI01049021.1:50-793(+)